MNILLATDGSECAATAGRLLVALPLPDGSSIQVLSALPPPHWIATPSLGAEGSLYPMLAEVAAEEQAAAERNAEAAAVPFRDRGLKVTATVRREAPADLILDQAEEDGAELIVVGSHGKGAVERFLLGSVSERVARHAHCSVLVARGDTLRRAIVAVDGTEASEHALDAVTRLPLPPELPITAVNVLRPSELAPPLPLAPGVSWDSIMEQYDQERRQQGERIANHARDRIRKTGRHCVIDVRLGAPADEIVAAARESGSDLIIVGAANRSVLGRLFLGSVSGRVLSHAPCSVLVARSESSVATLQI